MSFQWHVLLRSSVLFLVFFLRNFLYMKGTWQAGMSLETFWEFSSTFLHFSYQAEAFNGCYDKLFTIKWFDFCLSRTLRVVFKWLIYGGRWIITDRSYITLLYIMDKNVFHAIKTAIGYPRKLAWNKICHVIFVNWHKLRKNW